MMMGEEGTVLVRRRSSVVADDEASDFLASMRSLGITDEDALEDDAHYNVHPFEEDDRSSIASGLSYTYSPANLNQGVLLPCTHLRFTSVLPREDQHSKRRRMSVEQRGSQQKHEEFEAELPSTP